MIDVKPELAWLEPSQLTTHAALEFRRLNPPAPRNPLPPPPLLVADLGASKLLVHGGMPKEPAPAMIVPLALDEALLWRYQLDPPAKPVEKALAAAGLANFDLPWVVDSVLPLWGEPPKAAAWHRFQRLNDVGESVLRWAAERRAPLNAIEIHRHVPESMRAAWLSAMIAARLSVAESLQATEDLLAILSGDAFPATVRELVQLPPDRQGFVKTMASLARPWQQDIDQKSRQLLKGWKLPGRSRVSLPKHLEQSEFTLHLEIRSPEEVRQLAEALRGVPDEVIQATLAELQPVRKEKM